MNIVLHDPKSDSVVLYTPSDTFRFENRNQEVASSIDDNDVILIESLSLVSKTQFMEWLKLSSWFEKFPLLSPDNASHMSLVFYDTSANLLRVCDPQKGIEDFNFDDSELATSLPDNIAYIESLHLMTKKQFINWLGSELSITQDVVGERKYIHPVHEGTILIEDIQTNGEPLKLSGKYHFIPIDTIGEQVLENSVHFRVLKKKGKIEVVGEDYVQANKHKYKKLSSPLSTLPVGSVDDFIKETSGDIITLPL